MKRFVKTLFLACATAALLTGTALADSGPKPQLVVKVVNGPKESYYLDLLAEGEGGNNPNHTDEWNPDMLSHLLAAVPEGWHACMAQGTDAPVFGDLTGEDGLHTFGYYGVPSTYRVLMVTQSGEIWVSDSLRRNTLQSSVTVDWAAKSAKTPPVWRGYGLQFLSTLLLTLFIEGLWFCLFRLNWKKNGKPFLAVNLATQGALAVWMSVYALQSGVGWSYLLFFLPVEMAIAFAEAGLYTKLFQDVSRGRAFLYGLTANAVSAYAGWLCMEPIWKWIVSLS